MQQTVGKILRILATLWLAAVVLLILGGSISYIIFADDKWRATTEVWNQFSPFNIGYLLTVFVLAAPGLGLMALGKRLS